MNWGVYTQAIMIGFRQKFFWAFLVILCSPHLMASSLGHFSGLVKNESGEPVPGLLVALLQKSSDQVLPILARSDNHGKLDFKNVQPGSYELLVRSSTYRGPRNTIQILPAQTTVITLILQQLLPFDSTNEENIGIKALLRGTDEKRLIFRGLPGQSTQADLRSANPRSRKTVFEIYSTAGLDSDYLVVPTDSAKGMVSNFAIVESLGSAANYTLAGQLNSGEDSLWRLKALFDYQASDTHSLNFSVGYSRLSFNQPSMALINNPSLLSQNSEFTRTIGNTEIITLGVEDNFRLSEAFSLLWGLEVNKIQAGQDHTIINPTAGLSYSPSSRTHVRFLTTSKRHTQTGSMTLPNGELLNLQNSVYLSKVDHNLGIGTSHYYLGSLSHYVADETEIELAAFTNHYSGPTTPFWATFPGKRKNPEVLHLDDSQANNHGYRITVRQKLFDRIKTSFSYVRGMAAGVDPQNTVLLLNNSTSLKELVSKDSYRAFSAAIETYLSYSQTHINALIKVIPDGSPISTLDSFSDTYNVGNEGINLFVRQVVPIPVGFLSLLGLDFLSTYKVEALLDVRNLTNQNLSAIPTSLGNILLIRNPRSMRGGIAVRF